MKKNVTNVTNSCNSHNYSIIIGDVINKIRHQNVTLVTNVKHINTYICH